MRPRLLLVAACLVALGTSRAHANPAPPLEPPERPPLGTGEPLFMFQLVNTGSGIPANGALLLEGPYDQVPTVLVRELSTNTFFTGTVEPIEGAPYWVWRPDDPLPVGAVCEVEIASDATGSSWADIDVVAAIELEQPAIVTAPAASLISVAAERACCRTQFTAGYGLEATSQCFTIGNESSVHVDPGVLTMSGQAQANQYLFRFSTGPDARPVYSTGSFNRLVLPVYREQADEYCFEVAAIELPTLRELAYDDVDTCAEHGTLADLGPSPVEPSAFELSRAICHAPPIGYEEPWCEVNEDCEEGDSTSGCRLYPHVCEGEALPAWGAEGDASAAGEGGDDAGREDEPQDDDAQSGSSGGGCAVTGMPGERGGVARLAFLTAFVLVARRLRLAKQAAGLNAVRR